jgi:crotonobetainyl-CoA:carnitine CoA-transferase CaiB-like acyl-CoA transferase
VADVFADPQVVHRQMQLQLTAAWAAGGTLPSIRTPVRFSDASLSIDRPSPRLGEHTTEVLSELGLATGTVP